MKLILTLLVVALTGCGATMPPVPAAPANHNIAFTATDKHVEKLVNWVAVDDINAVCQQFIEKGKKILGCSRFTNSKCTVYTGRNTDLAILGHEIRHCFEGHWHN